MHSAKEQPKLTMVIHKMLLLCQTAADVDGKLKLNFTSAEKNAFHSSYKRL